MLAIRLKILANVFSRFNDFLQTHFTGWQKLVYGLCKKLNPIYRIWISYLWPDMAWPYLYSYFIEKYMALSSLRSFTQSLWEVHGLVSQECRRRKLLPQDCCFIQEPGQNITRAFTGGSVRKYIEWRRISLKLIHRRRGKIVRTRNLGKFYRFFTDYSVRLA